MIRAYPWDRLPQVRGRDLPRLRAASRFAVGKLLPRHRSILGDVEITTGIPRIVGSGDEMLPLADPTAVTLALLSSSTILATVTVPGSLVRRLAWYVIDEGRQSARSGDSFDRAVGEICAPRPTTWVERGILAFAACALLDTRFPGVAVEVLDRANNPLCEGASPVAVPLSVAVAGSTHWSILIIAESTRICAPMAAPCTGHWAGRAFRIDGISVQMDVLVGSGRVPFDELAGLRSRDVLVLHSTGSGALLAVGRGAVPVSLDRDTGRVIVRGTYERGAPMNEMTAEDIVVEVSCRVGTVSLSVRRVLELAPGQVLRLDRPLGGPVDIVCGSQLIGRGELVDVDGEIGVRVLSLTGSP
ncbi:MAG: FliM/FliN family flagellar motor switch protein [Proteobacteria bacterium]|nr:FliM/FliN family flagellar motor switch protein [Pseudomonadota bacterium]